MQMCRVETVISQNGILTIRSVPFRAGDKLEIIVLGRPHGREAGECYPLRGKPIRYTAPFESVAEDEWDALR